MKEETKQEGSCFALTSIDLLCRPLPAITPFYSEDGITIYNADCAKVLPFLPTFDLLLTDPPYGIGRDGQKLLISKRKHGGRKAYNFEGWDAQPPEKWLLEMCISKSENQIIWGANYFPHVFPPKMGWLVWDKGQDISASDCELAYSSRDNALRRLVLNRVALLKDGTSHPTQKPLALIKWCLGFFPEAKTVLDPFMGSGTTLRAAKDLGLSAVGIEINESYCQTAVERLRQRTLGLT